MEIYLFLYQISTATYRPSYSSDDNHTKNVRSICQLLFATNPSCATLLHHLVAETAEVNGGTRKLIRVLNRLVSNDVHDILVTDVAEKQKAKPVWNELSPDIFTVQAQTILTFVRVTPLCTVGTSPEACM